MKSLDNNSKKEISNDNKDSTNKRKRDKGTSMEEPPKKIIIKRYNNFDDFLKEILNHEGPYDDEDDTKLDTIDDSESSDDEDEENKELIFIKDKIKNLNDLIKLGKTYDKTKRYTFDMKKLNKMVSPLEDLNNMIGMNLVKKNIVDHILFFLQKLDTGLNNMLHTVIQGPPGTGKTELAKKLSKIYLAMGILKNDTFKIVKRGDLIGKYLGHTAIKTQKVIDSCAGGVMFIDEAYSLGSGDGKDIYSKECIDTLNQNLTENKNKFICIIAGYKNDLNDCFFSMNKGLDRRFSIRYTIEKYDGKELFEIFKKIVKDNEWKISEKASSKFFETNKDNFPFFGGDMETLFFNCKLVHGRRIFGKDIKLKKIITNNDIKNAYQIFINNKNKNITSDVWKNLYV